MTKDKPKKKMGRPTIYTQELADTICEFISQGMSMRSVCRQKQIPEMPTIWRWIRENEEFGKQYASACQNRTDAQNEMLIDMGDEAIEASKKSKGGVGNAVVQAYKLKADNFRWVMSKMKPKKYGDRLDLTTLGEKLPAPIYGGKAK